LKCYLHPDTEAVGVCIHCGRGVCEAHSVMIGGRLYCKEDANSVFSSRMKSKVRENERPTAITIACVSLYVYGGIGIMFSVVLLLASVFLASIPILGSGVASIQLYAIGGSILIVALLGISGGYMMWKSQRNGGYVSAISLFLGLIIAIVLYASAPSLSALETCLTFSVINIVLLVLISLGWESFSQFEPRQLDST